jgi:hypothetical protein
MFVAIIGFANPGRVIEQERQPANPKPELTPTDCLYVLSEVESSVDKRSHDAKHRVCFRPSSRSIMRQ